MPEPQRGVAYTFSLALLDALTGALRVNPTLATGDFRVAKDHGAFATLATLPSVAPAGSTDVQVQLSAAEMTADQVDLWAHDPDGEWDDVFIQIQPSRAYGTDGKVLLSSTAQTGVVLPRVTLVDTLQGHTPQTGDSYVRLGTPAGASVSADVAAVKVDTTTLIGRLTALRAGYLDNLNISGLVASQTSVDQIRAKTDTLPTDPADASDMATSFAQVQTSLATIAGYIDTEVAAIKAKTDALPPDPADASDIAASFAQVNTTLATLSGYVDTEVAAIKARTDTLPAQPAAVGSPMTLQANAITAAVLAAEACVKIADILARRHTNAIETSTEGDTLHINSLYGLLAIGTGHARDTTTHEGALTVFRANGTTELAQLPIETSDVALPIVSVGD